jgi:tetratricopeptide (TPR) repeat protein
MLVEEGPIVDSGIGKEEKDHISKNELPSDQSFKDYIAVVNEAVRYLEGGLYEEAAEELKKAISLEPSMPYAYDNLANAYYHLRKYREAIAMAETALRMDPDYANAYGNLGNIYYALGKHKEARENYQKAKGLFQKKGDLEGVARVDKSLAQSFS